MKLLLDTHAFLWLINDDYAHLRGKAAIELFLADDTMPFLSLASVWEMAIKIRATNLTRDTEQGLTVRPELVEGWTVNPLMVRQAHHERIDLCCPALSW